MADVIAVEDIPASIRDQIDPALLTTMIAGLNGRAARVAPCLDATDPAPSAELLAEAKLVLIGAIKRWGEAGSGAFQSQTAGPFSVAMDTRQRAGFNLWPSEVAQLQELCQSESSGAFAIDTVPAAPASNIERLFYEEGTFSTPDTWTAG